MRYGCIAARIGADVSHKLGIDMPVQPPQYGTATNVRSATRRGGKAAKESQYEMGPDERQLNPSGIGKLMVPKVVKAGTRITQTVEDITRYPDEAKAAYWVCHHPECRGEKHKSKKDLLAAHPPNKELAKEQQTHMYYAVFEEAGTPAKPAQLDAEGKVKKAEVEAVDARVLLLSDEE
jgi:hypothetical protein